MPRWVIRHSNITIKMDKNRQLGNSSIITTESMTPRGGVLVARTMIFKTWRLKGDSKVVIHCYNKKSNLPSSITLLVEVI